MSKPRVEGLPATRPRCPNCGRQLAYLTINDGTRWWKWRGYPLSAPVYCRLRCAFEHTAVLRSQLRDAVALVERVATVLGCASYEADRCDCTSCAALAWVAGRKGEVAR